jgi:hypothetical protein
MSNFTSTLGSDIQDELNKLFGSTEDNNIKKVNTKIKVDSDNLSIDSSADEKEYTVENVSLNKISTLRDVKNKLKVYVKFEKNGSGQLEVDKRYYLKQDVVGNITNSSV